MGINFNKINISPVSMICPEHFVDFHQAGSVYFVKHKSTCEKTTGVEMNELEKKTHFAVAIDITGNLKNVC